MTIELSKDRISQLKLLVIGDTIIDHYVYCTAKELSREAPIPILNYQSEKYTLGGAGNLIANLFGLGIDPDNLLILSTLSDDNEIISLSNLCFYTNKENGTLNIEKDENCKNLKPSKNRYMCNNSQVMCMDINDNNTISDFINNNIETTVFGVKESIKNNNIDGIIISDYGRGNCTELLCREIIKIATENNIRVFIDPRKYSWDCYKAAFTITPNFNEILMITDRENFEEKDIKELLTKYDLSNIIITRGKDGAALYNKDGSSYCYSVEPLSLCDTSGAGDTVLAVFAVSYLLTSDLSKSFELTKEAARIVIMKSGTVPIKYEELFRNSTAVEE